MRIISGDMKGRQIRSIEGLRTRPTSDKVKGAIFNTLRDKVCGASVLDLFAGTGNMALEALSRGSRKAVLVDKSREAQLIIRKNIEITGVVDRASLIRSDALRYISRYGGESFDLIFLDPPYREGLVSKTLALLREKACLTANGVIVAETAGDETIEGDLYPFEIRKTGNYGDTKVWYIQRSDT